MYWGERATIKIDENNKETRNMKGKGSLYTNFIMIRVFFFVRRYVKKNDCTKKLQDESIQVPTSMKG